MTAPVVSVVVPVLDEEGNLQELHDRVGVALDGIPHELVLVDDGSTDRSVEMIESWIARGEDVVLVKLSRNFGMEVAMSAGLDHARGEYVVLMHADLQDPPELVPEMLAKARAGADVVYTRRIGRDESLIKRQLATAFYKLMERLARTPYQGQAGDFRLMSRRVVRAAARDARAPPLPARHGRLGGLRPGADRVPARRAPRGPRRVLPRAVPARDRGARVVLRRAAGAGDRRGDGDRGAGRRRRRRRSPSRRSSAG